MTRLRRERCSLLIVDLQKRLMDIVVRRDSTIGNILRLLEATRILEVPILATDQNRKVFGSTLDAIRERLPSPPSDKLIFSAFAHEPIHAALERSGRRQLLVTGIMTNVCVLQTTLDALEDGFAVHVVADAVTAADENDHQVGLDRLRQAGAIITNTETTIYELLERAGTDEFRACLPLLRR